MLKYINRNPYRTVNIWGSEVQTKSSFLYQLFKKLSNGYSPIIGICGCQQNGKSFVGVWLSMLVYLIKKMPFDPTKITFYEPDKAMESIGEKNKDVIFIDEASDVMDYQEWYKQTHRALRSMVNTQAYKNNLYIFISPFLVQIDKSIRIHCDFIIKVAKRGNFKVWKIVKQYDADNINRATFRIFIGDVTIRMRDVPKEIWKKYKQYSFEQKEEIRKRRIAEKDEKKKEFSVDEAVKISKKNKGSGSVRQLWEI